MTCKTYYAQGTVDERLLAWRRLESGQTHGQDEAEAVSLPAGPKAKGRGVRTLSVQMRRFLCGMLPADEGVAAGGARGASADSDADDFEGEASAMNDMDEDSDED